MSKHMKLCGLALVCAGLALGGCLIQRNVAMNNMFHTNNTITERGFTYAKKGVEVRYMVEGIFPAKLKRPELLAQLSVGQNAYAKLWKAAGGLKDNQRLVNLVIESSFVKKVGFGADLFLVVHIYADVVELDAGGGAPAPAPAPDVTGSRTPADHPLAAEVRRQIDESVLRAAARHHG